MARAPLTVCAPAHMCYLSMLTLPEHASTLCFSSPVEHDQPHSLVVP